MGLVKRMVLNYLLKQLTEKKLGEWADLVKGKVLPYLHEKKKDLLAELLEEAKKTETKLDDILLKKLDDFLDAFFPDNDKRL